MSVNLHFSRCTAALQLLSRAGLNDGLGEISVLLLLLLLLNSCV